MPYAEMKHSFKTGHITWELGKTTYSLSAGEAIIKNDKRKLFTGVIRSGGGHMGTELRRLAHEFDSREDDLKDK